MTGVPRAMLAFHQDAANDWVARLDCGHDRHVRHRPPLSSYPWIMTEEGRAAHVGQPIECELCTRRSFPDGFAPYRSTRDFDADTVPAALLADHRTKAGVWGLLEVDEGELALCFHPPIDARVHVGAEEPAAIPPGVTHHVELRGPVRFRVHFCRPGDRS